MFMLQNENIYIANFAFTIVSVCFNKSAKRIYSEIIPIHTNM